MTIFSENPLLRQVQVLATSQILQIRLSNFASTAFFTSFCNEHWRIAVDLLTVLWLMPDTSRAMACSNGKIMLSPFNKTLK